ncbi:unnamed protein product [Allacma fusca]|uniref:Uncharacterized protein n=1 Tax=Allacma fusca TaxID=39272 RepID=A0A8J2KI30_9HEXA|nr:unnamed protein product [Allacma fusca]
MEHYSSGLTMKPMKTSVSVQLKTSPVKTGPKNNLCFHCEERTCPYNRVHCHMCERYCHLMCLQLTSVPLEGDKFWDVMCSACGTQNVRDKEQNRVFSVRRSINSWSDVVHLIINCLKVKSMGQQYFDFETQIIPFFDSNMDKLHLPSKFKSASPDDRKSNLLAALTSSRLRFTKQQGPEKIPKLGEAGKTLWALRSDKSNQSDSSPETPATSSTSIRLPRRNLMVSPSNKSPDKPSDMDISPPPVPKASLPLSLKNRMGSNSSALSIFSIPNPYGNTNSVSPAVSANVNYPRVLSKETVLKNPITTNIVLAPTNSATSTTARFSCKSITTTKGTTFQTPQKVESNHRQRLRIRLPLKPPSTDKEKEPPALSPARPELSTPKKNHTNKIGTEGPHPRKRLLSSGGEDSDKDSTAVQPPKQSKNVPLSPTMPQLTKQDQASGVPLKSPEPISSTAAREAIGNPAVPSLRLSLTRGRPKLLRSTVLNSTNKSIRGKGSRGRGRPVSRLIPPKESSNSSQNSNDSSSRSSLAVTLNGIWRSDSKVSISNGTQTSTNGLKIKKVPWNPPPPQSPEGLEDMEDDPRKTFYGNLLNAAMFTGLRVKCLPKPFEEDRAKRTVAELYTEDANCYVTDEPENNTKMEIPSKTKNRFGKNLDDLESYEIAATKIGPDGMKKYLVVWKEPIQNRQLDFDEEIDRLFFRSRMDTNKNHWTDPTHTLNGCRIKSETDKKYPTLTTITKNSKQLDSKKMLAIDDDITILKHSPVKSSSSCGTSSKSNCKPPVTCVIDLTDSS